MKLPPKKCYFWAVPVGALIIFLWWYFLQATTSILETLPCCKLHTNHRTSPSPNNTVLNKTSTPLPYLSEYQKVVWSILDVDATVSLPVPHIGSYQCQDQICSEFLSATDVDRMKTCIDPGKPANIVPKCHFMNGTHRSPVALVSFPGSGNTWVRGLLEKATGICTGSLYCDRAIRNSGSIAERVRTGCVLIVKTHQPALSWSRIKAESSPGPPTRTDFGAAILIIRNPMDAFVSEWNRLQTVQQKLTHDHKTDPHKAVLTEDYFRDYQPWNDFVTHSATKWKEYIVNLVLDENLGHSVLVVRYEDLKRDTIAEVKRILDFLKVPYTDSWLKMRLADSYNRFHRTTSTSFEHFTENQKFLVHRSIQEMYLKLQYRRKGSLILKDYL